jgi:hypothetical protein
MMTPRIFSLPLTALIPAPAARRTRHPRRCCGVLGTALGARPIWRLEVAPMSMSGPGDAMRLTP